MQICRLFCREFLCYAILFFVFTFTLGTAQAGERAGESEGGGRDELRFVTIRGGGISTEPGLAPLFFPVEGTGHDEDQIEPPDEESGGRGPLAWATPQDLEKNPLRISNNSYFHGLLHVPPMEGSFILKPGTWQLQFSLEASSAARSDVDPDFFFNFDAYLFTGIVHTRWGVGKRSELDGSLSFGKLIEQGDDIVLARAGDLLIEPGTRGLTPDDLVLGYKYVLVTSEGDNRRLATRLFVKIPVGDEKENVITSGQVDYGVQLIGTLTGGKRDAFFGNVNIGYVLPGDVDSFEEDVKTDGFVAYAVSGGWEVFEDFAFLVQVQGNRSAFPDRDSSIGGLLNEDPLTVHAGVRFRVGGYYLEFSGGAGINDSSSDSVATFTFSFRF